MLIRYEVVRIREESKMTLRFLVLMMDGRNKYQRENNNTGLLGSIEIMYILNLYVN